MDIKTICLSSGLALTVLLITEGKNISTFRDLNSNGQLTPMKMCDWMPTRARVTSSRV